MRIRCLSINYAGIFFFFENNSIRWNFVRIFGVIKHYRSVVSHCGIFTGIKYLIIVITFLSLSVVYK